MRISEQLIKNLPRPRIPFHAAWAIMKKPYNGDIHYLEGSKIVYDVIPGVEFADHIEMSGFKAASIISYGNKANGRLRFMRHVVFPALRTYPNKTHNSLDHNFKGVSISANGKKTEIAEKYVFDGTLHVYSHIDNVKIERVLSPSVNYMSLIEIIKIKNNGLKPVKIDIIDNDGQTDTPAYYGHVRRKYYFSVNVSTNKSILESKEESVVEISYNASENKDAITIDCVKELAARYSVIDTIDTSMSVITPDKYINTMIKYSKIRACESIFKFKKGLMHSPGGGAFYAAVWNNDQCEYVNPLFAYLGYGVGVEQAIDCFNYYIPYMDSSIPLISSIISCGDGYWNGAGDRGDNSMYAYGLTRFLLSVGDKKTAEN